VDQDSEVPGQLLGGISGGDPKQPGHEADYIPMGTAAEAVEASAQLQARMAILMEGAPGHSGGIHFQAVLLSCIPAGDAVLQRLKIAHGYSPFSLVIITEHPLTGCSRVFSCQGPRESNTPH
jgi:hypothetical protein